MTVPRSPSQRRLGVRPTAVLVAVATGLTLAGVPSPASAAPSSQAEAPRCRSGVPADVNGDGYAEVAISEQGGAYHQGAVHVLYGTAAGLVTDRTGTALDDQLITQATPGIPGRSRADNRFGQRTVFGDLNADGCADLVISAAGESGGDGDGSVIVVPGSPQGLRPSAATHFTLRGLFGRQAPRYTLFGLSLAVGDLDGDGVDDLAAGAPRWRENTGAVAVLFGHVKGLDRGPARAVWLRQGTPGVPGTDEEGDGWGTSVAVADVDGRGPDELIVGAPGEDGRGSVQVLSRRAGRFTGSARIDTASPGMPPGSEGPDFGATVAAGDLTGDGRAEVVVGSPNEGAIETEGGDFDGPGAVYVLRGTTAGLTSTGAQRWTTRSPGVESAGIRPTAFGSSLAVGRLDGDAYGDLAVGSPGDEIGGVDRAGTVTLLRGSSTGPTTAGSGGTVLRQGTAGIPGAAEPGDLFGLTLVASHVASRAQATLVVAAPGEGPAGIDDTGLVHQLALSPSGPTGTGGRALTLGTPGLRGPMVADRNFGLAVAGDASSIDLM